jgi:hypothetical protein
MVQHVYTHSSLCVLVFSLLGCSFAMCVFSPTVVRILHHWSFACIHWFSCLSVKWLSHPWSPVRTTWLCDLSKKKKDYMSNHRDNWEEDLDREQEDLLPFLCLSYIFLLGAGRFASFPLFVLYISVLLDASFWFSLDLRLPLQMLFGPILLTVHELAGLLVCLFFSNIV